MATYPSNPSIIVKYDSINEEDVLYRKVTRWVDGIAFDNTRNDPVKIDGTIFIAEPYPDPNRPDRTLYAFYKRIFNGDLYSKWFVKDPTQDDTEPLNKAMEVACNLSVNLCIDSRKHSCENYSISNSSVPKILNLTKGGPGNTRKIKIYGQPGTIISTTKDSGALFYVYYRCVNIIFEGIKFENTHSLTISPTYAIQLLGTGDNLMCNISIKNCGFSGFSTSIVAQGVRGLTIVKNRFTAPLGHDNAQYSTGQSEPAVNIWLHDNTNGQCYDVKIKDNIADGYTSTAPISALATKRCMDGFVFGVVYGGEISGNTTRNFTEEHYFLHPASNAGMRYPVSIKNNILHLALPEGSEKDGQPVTSNFGIRADVSNVEVSGNALYEYTSGITVRLIPDKNRPMQQGENYVITNNRFFAPKNKPTYHVREAIKVQGNNTDGYRAENIVIADNTAFIKGVTMKSKRAIICVYDCENAVVKNNTAFVKDVTSETADASLFGILYGRSTSVIDYKNRLSNRRTEVELMPYTEITFE